MNRPGYRLNLLTEDDEDFGQEWDLDLDQDQKWDRAEFEADFVMLGFASPFVVVKRRSDDQLGTLEYTTNLDGWPICYFSWQPSADKADG